MGLQAWPSAVLFDASGTLIELRESVGSTYSRIAEAHGVSLPAWRLDDAFRRTLSTAPPRVFPEASPTETPAHERQWWRELVRSTFLAADSTIRFRDFESFFAALFCEYSDASVWRARPHAAELLTDLQDAGLRLGVISNFDMRLPSLLDCLGIGDFLSTIILPADCGAEKPDPRIFAAALTALQLPAEQCVYVGDDAERDLAGADRAGLTAIDVREMDSLEGLPARLQSLATLRSAKQRSCAHD